MSQQYTQADLADRYAISELIYRYCRAGRWGLDRRTLVMDFDEIRPVTEMNRHERARRDASDPSYAVLG